MDVNRKERYAKLLIDTALDLQPGQYLYIETSIEAEEFIAMVTRAALEKGAADVLVRWMSTAVDRERMANKNCTLGAVKAEQAEADWVIENGGALLRLESPNMKAFSGIEAGRLQSRAAGEFALHVGFRTRGTAQNVIACVATPSWAHYVFPDLAPEAALERLWDCVLGSVMADCTDPDAEWRSVIAKTNKRREILNEKQYSRIHITGKNTDLYMDMPQPHGWDGGGMTNPDGIFFMPNLPSYEVFSSPRADSVEGHVVSTLPLNHSGGLIRDIELVFKEGRVVEFHASEGEDLLRELLQTDENSNRLGEVAIVEHGSPVQRQGIIFYTTICDENAACHLALGNGFCRQGAEEAKRLGINTSSIHVDFMIGASDTCVQGYSKTGEWEDILVNGTWVF